jgi:hypothetical protein
MAHHVSNDLRLLPAWDKDGDAALVNRLSSGNGRAGGRRLWMSKAVDEANQDRNEIVNSADKQSNG